MQYEQHKAEQDKLQKAVKDFGEFINKQIGLEKQYIQSKVIR